MRIGEVRDLGKIMGEKMSTTGEKGIYCHVCLLFRSHGYVSSRYDIQAVGYGRGRRAYEGGRSGAGMVVRGRQVTGGVPERWNSGTAYTAVILAYKKIKIFGAVA